MTIITLVLMLLAQSGTFSLFTYCHEYSRGPYEFQCIDLDDEGTGEIRFKRRESDLVTVDIQLSPAGNERFIAVVAATDHLADGESYESQRRVADLGLKRLSIELPSGRREASYNYSSREEVIELTSFFEGLINQEILGFDIESALQFDRLSMPKRLDQIEKELREDRIADPWRLISLLEKIQGDSRVMNFARTHARRLQEQIEAGR